VPPSQQVLCPEQAAESGSPRACPQWLSSCHPVAIGAAVTAAGALAWIIFFPRVGTDLSAALARASWASHYPGAAYLFS
jgi:hypothetical protein